MIRENSFFAILPSLRCGGEARLGGHLARHTAAAASDKSIHVEAESDKLIELNY